MLGARVRLRSKRDTLHTMLQQSIGRMGAAHDAMKRHMISQGLVIPQEISAMWTGVEETRNKLSEEEHIYREAEQQYNEEERQYSNFETKFIEDLAATPAAREKYARMTTKSRSNTVDSVVIEDSLPALSVADTIPDLLNPPSLQISTNSAMIPEDILREHRELYATSPHPPDGSHTPELIDLRSELSPKRRPISWLETHGFIDGWLLDIFEKSLLQQTFLQQFIPQGSLSRTAWLEWIVHHWDKSMFKSIDFHTGDTTISSTQSDRSRPLAVKKQQPRLASAAATQDDFNSTPPQTTAAGSIAFDSVFLESSSGQDSPSPSPRPPQVGSTSVVLNGVASLPLLPKSEVAIEEENSSLPKQAQRVSIPPSDYHPTEVSLTSSCIEPPCALTSSWKSCSVCNGDATTY